MPRTPLHSEGNTWVALHQKQGATIGHAWPAVAYCFLPAVQVVHVHVGRLEQIRGQQVLGHSLDIDQVGASCAHSPQLSALSYDALHFHPSGFMHHTKPWYNPQNHSLKTHHQGTAELPLGRENSRGNKITKLHEHKVSPSKTITVIAACDLP